IDDAANSLAFKRNQRSTMRRSHHSQLVLASVLFLSSFLGLSLAHIDRIQAGEQESPARLNRALPRSAPERQGISSSDLLAFVDAADNQIDQMHSFMLVRHGHVVAEGWWT